MILRRSSHKMRSEARFLKQKLHDLFPKEICRKHRKRNWLIQKYRQRKKEIEIKETPHQKSCNKIEDAYCYQSAGAFRELKLREHFKPHQIQQILDDKHYYFGDESKYWKMIHAKSQQPSACQLTHQDSKRRLTSSSVNHRQAFNPQPVRKKMSEFQKTQKVARKKYELDARQLMRRQEATSSKEERIEKYRSWCDKSKEQSKQMKQFQKSEKLELAKSRLHSNFIKDKQNQQLNSLHADLKRICWHRVKLEKAFEKTKNSKRIVMVSQHS